MVHHNAEKRVYCRGQQGLVLFEPGSETKESKFGYLHFSIYVEVCLFVVVAKWTASSKELFPDCIKESFSLLRPSLLPLQSARDIGGLFLLRGTRRDIILLLSLFQCVQEKTDMEDREISN